jgi:hypothetical protein
MKKQMRSIGIAYGLLWVFCGTVCAQPPTVPKAPSPALPPLTVEEMETIFGKPVSLSLNYQNAPLSSIFADIEKQSGIEIGGAKRDNAGLGDRVGRIQNKFDAITSSIQIKDTPFWAAIEEVLAASSPYGLYVSEHPTPLFGEPAPAVQFVVPFTQVVNQAVNNGAPPTIFRQIPQQIHPYVSLKWKGASRTTSQHLRYGSAVPEQGKTQTQSATLNGQVLFDPRLFQVPLQMRIRLDTVQDAKGKTFPFTQRWPHVWERDSLVRALDISLPGEMTTAQGKVASVKGALRLVLETRQETWEVPNVLNAKGTAKTWKTPHGDLTLKIVDLTTKNGQYEIQIQGQSRPENNIVNNVINNNNDGPGFGNSFESLLQGWAKRVQLFDAKGVAYAGGMRRSTGNGTTLDVTLGFSALKLPNEPLPGEPSRLIIEVPIEERQLEIPFEVKDLTLP